jgi:hypothetical protein
MQGLQPLPQQASKSGSGGGRGMGSGSGSGTGGGSIASIVRRGRETRGYHRPPLNAKPVHSMITPLARALALAGATLLGSVAAAKPGDEAPWVVTYPSTGAAGDERGDYYVSLLKLALGKADGHFVVQPSADPSVALRAFANMGAGRVIDVIWSPTSLEYERDYLPVRIPLDKGLLGWRIFLIGDADRGLFEGLHSLEQLKALPAGQVGEWVDTAILRANGLPVVTATRYENLFRMLAAQRFRYLPRGIGEIAGELHNYGPLGLSIEPHLALHYPMCTYFFVSRQNAELARRIEQGLHRALKDGAFEQLFRQFYGPSIQAAKLDKRQVFELDNPTVSPSSCPRSGIPTAS